MNASFYLKHTYDQGPYTACSCSCHQTYDRMKERWEFQDNTEHTGYQTADYELSLRSDIKYTGTE